MRSVKREMSKVSTRKQGKEKSKVAIQYKSVTKHYSHDHKICIHTIMTAAIFSDTFSNLVQVSLELTVPMKNQRILILY